MLKTRNNKKSSRLVYYKYCKFQNAAMVDATKTTANPIGHMIVTQAPAACDKNIFHLFRFTQPVKNYSNHCTLIWLPLKLFFSVAVKFPWVGKKHSSGIIIYCSLVLLTSPLVLLSACSRSCSS